MYEFTFTHNTNCLMLKRGSNLIDTKFYNRFTDTITLEQLEQDSKEIAAKHNITSYAIDFTNIK